MARPRKQAYTMKQYLDNIEEGYISNDADTQRNPAWESIVDGLAVTVLTEDYIPPIILAEEDSGQIHIVDGGSRTAALRMIKDGNYKIKASVENPIIKYRSMSKDENGETVWSDEEFDIRNKTYDQFPKELKKRFNEYQIETVIHEHCDEEKIAMYIQRYNEQSKMSAHQKMFVYIPKFAKKIKKIINKQFFINFSNFTENEKKKGMLERVISESLMCMFHLKKWNKNGKKLASYLNKNATEEEFNVLEKNIARLEKIVTDETKVLFNSKNTFIWLTIFEKFTKLGLEDNKFGEFLCAFVNGLRDKEVDGKLFDKADDNGSTKDKSVINDKLHILETLMHEFLHINEEEIKEESIVDFVRENIKSDVTEDDVELYELMLDDFTLEVDNDTKLLNKENRKSLVGLVAYACENDTDNSLEEWIKQWFAMNVSYIVNQRENYLHMVRCFESGAIA